MSDDRLFDLGDAGVRDAAQAFLERHRRLLAASGAPSFGALAQLLAHLAEVERALQQTECGVH